MLHYRPCISKNACNGPLGTFGGGGGGGGFAVLIMRSTLAMVPPALDIVLDETVGDVVVDVDFVDVVGVTSPINGFGGGNLIVHAGVAGDVSGAQ